MSQTHLLYRLQTLDSKIDKAKRTLAEVTTNLGESDVLKQARSAVETAADTLRQAQTTMKDLELEVKGLSDKISNQEKLLYSGKNLSAKEATNLQDEITSLKRWHANREERLLETMVEAEEKGAMLSQAQQALSQIEATWQSEQDDLIQQRASLESEIAALQEQRPTIAQAIEAGTLADYNVLRSKKAGVAVAGVKDSMCQSCGIMVSNSKVQRARTGTELMYCGSCGRILYIF